MIVIEEIGASKVMAVVTYNAAAWDIITENNQYKQPSEELFNHHPSDLTRSDIT